MIVDSATKPLEILVTELPPTLRMEVRNFVEFLIAKNEVSIPRRLRQDWAESLHDTSYSLMLRR